MLRSTRPFLVAFALLALLATPAGAKRSRLAHLVMPIADAWEYAEKGDRVVIEGVVVSSAGSRIFLIRDDSGEMHLRIPESLRREHGVPQRHERIRVAGRFTDSYLDEGKRGIHVQALERLGRDDAKSGGEGAAATPPARPRKAAAPAASDASPAAPAPRVISPRTPADWKERLGDARQRLLRAERASKQANTDFARAVSAGGSEDAVDPAITRRREEADAELAAARQDIPKLVEGARSAGVDPKILDIYESWTVKR
jgi:uncharacterized protein YdeI (BOF family)